MRLVVNATSYGDRPGGAGIRARELFGALMDRSGGYDLLFLLAEDTPAWVVPPGAETRVLPVRAAHPLRRWRNLRIPDEGDLLFTDHYPAVPRPPTVLTLHDDGGGWLRRRAIRRHLARAAAVVAVSAAVRDAWELDCAVVHNGVAPSPGPLPDAGRHLLMCDPGVAHKGAEIARRAAAILRMELREVGRGVQWLSREAIQREFAGAAAVLCPSRTEGFSMVPLEAMALGRPVVVSDIPAHREICGDHAFYGAGDWPDAVMAALEATPARLAAARAHARTFTWKRAAEQLEAVIRRLV